MVRVVKTPLGLMEDGVCVLTRNRKKKFKLPSLDNFDRFEDLQNNVRNYRAKTALHGASETKMCLTFSTALKSTTRV